MLSTMIWDGLSPRALSDRECLQVLAKASIGRLGVTVGALPTIVPVRFGLIDDEIVFAIGAGTTLEVATTRQVLCFEVDDFDPDAERGRVVVVTGRGELLTDENDIGRARTQSPAMWRGAFKDAYVRIVPELTTGRELVAGQA